jgi:hypothetical protein
MQLRRRSLSKTGSLFVPLNVSKYYSQKCFIL